jgi:F-type H+-transporting ATPase subunit epsilon
MTLQLEVLTPEKLALDTAVDMVELQGEDGRLGILPEHTTLISLLSFGVLTYKKEKQTETLLCGEGFLEVSGNKVTVLVHSAERTEDIDLERAKHSLERAKNRINSKAHDVDLLRAELALKRALVRMNFKEHRL